MRTTLTKIFATVIASVLFLILGAGALHITVMPPWSDTSSDKTHNQNMFAVAGRKNINELPHPPYSSETYNEEFENGRIVIYETQLTPEGIREFYGSEFRRLGWEQKELPDAAAEYYQQEPDFSMYFTNGAGSCIINVEEQDSFTSIITLIKTFSQENFQ